MQSCAHPGPQQTLERFPDRNRPRCGPTGSRHCLERDRQWTRNASSCPACCFPQRYRRRYPRVQNCCIRTSGIHKTVRVRERRRMRSQARHFVRLNPFFVVINSSYAGCPPVLASRNGLASNGPSSRNAQQSGRLTSMSQQENPDLKLNDTQPEQGRTSAYRIHPPEPRSLTPR
jgi:hypothetical protein